MERLSLHDNPAAAQQANAQQGQPPQNVPLQPPSGPIVPQGPPQLPPQMFTTAAQLLDLTDSECIFAIFKEFLAGKGTGLFLRRQWSMARSDIMDWRKLLLYAVRVRGLRVLIELLNLQRNLS